MKIVSWMMTLVLKDLVLKSQRHHVCLLGDPIVFSNKYCIDKGVCRIESPVTSVFQQAAV